MDMSPIVESLVIKTETEYFDHDLEESTNLYNETGTGSPVNENISDVDIKPEVVNLNDCNNLDFSVQFESQYSEIQVDGEDDDSVKDQDINTSSTSSSSLSSSYSTISTSSFENKNDFGINFLERKYFTCAFCSYKTEYKYNLIRHAKSHERLPKRKTIYKCDKCPFESHQQCYLQRHLKVHSDTYYKCAHCDFVTKYKESLPKHLLKHKAPTHCLMYICNECDYETKDKLNLRRHMLTHKKLEDVEHFRCTQCNFVTKYQMSFNNHMLKIHNKDKIEKHKCPECDFSTYHKISLKNHVLTHRKPGEVPMYKCPECPYETKNKVFLPSHMKRHLDNVPCPKCKKMITPRGMTVHLKTHESEDVKKKYKCDQCDYGTLYYGNLSRHKKIMHSNKEDIDYKLCPECPFKTFENARLRRHIKEVHSEDAPEFKCTYESCTFTSKFNSCLKRHIDATHVNPDPVECPVCHKMSANIYTLRIHLKLHRRDNEHTMFQCTDCPYKTRYCKAIKSHIRKHKSSNMKKHRAKESSESEEDL